MSDAPEEAVELPASLKFLRVLVTVLTGVMILGLVVVISLLVIRLGEKPVAMPEAITIPDGQSVSAFTRGDGWYAVVTNGDEGEQILIFDADSGALQQTVEISTGD